MLLLQSCAGRGTTRTAVGLGRAAEGGPSSRTQGPAGTPSQAPPWGQRVVVSDAYRAELVDLRLKDPKQHTLLVAVELRHRDGAPVPGDITFDTAVTDNLLVEYNVGCEYQGFGPDGAETDVSPGHGAHRIVQTLNIGPLDERVRWLQISVTVYRSEAVPGRGATYELTPLEVLDLGRHPIPKAPPGRSAG